MNIIKIIICVVCLLDLSNYVYELFTDENFVFHQMKNMSLFIFPFNFYLKKLFNYVNVFHTP